MSFIDENFVKQIIKGRIAETIFEFMFREDGRYTVIPLGYENTTPELAQYSHLINQNSHVLDALRRAPDFALLGEKKDKAYLIEVKFRSRLSEEDMLEIVNEKLKTWKISHLFVITPHGFYYDSCQTIQNNNGRISPLDTYHISEELQQKYLKILNESIKT